LEASGILASSLDALLRMARSNSRKLEVINRKDAGWTGSMWGFVCSRVREAIAVVDMDEVPRITSLNQHQLTHSEVSNLYKEKRENSNCKREQQTRRLQVLAQEMKAPVSKISPQPAVKHLTLAAEVLESSSSKSTQ